MVAKESARDHWLEEMRSAFLYRALAASEPPGPPRELFGKLAIEAETQATAWAALATTEGGRAVPAAYEVDLRARIVARVAAMVGARRARPILRAMKVRGLAALDAPIVGHPLPTRVEDVGGRHRTAGSAGNLRAAVFGASDGLVSNTSLVLGVAGAASDERAVLLAGVAGLLAGALSMAAGEWVSVRSQREMVERQIAAEKDELALVYEARGLEPEEARLMAARIVASPAHALDVLAREELGIDPNELGSPWSAAVYSFLSFAVGASLPLVQLAFLAGPSSVALSTTVAAVSMFGVGAVTSLFTGGSALRSGLRMLAIGSLAGGATYLVGRLFGVAVS